MTTVSWEIFEALVAEMRETEIQVVFQELGSLTKAFWLAVFAIDDSLLSCDDIIAGTRDRSTILNYRFCGKVVCYRCSANRCSIPQERLIRNPFDDSIESLVHPQLHRVCDLCVPVLEGLATASAHTQTLSNAVGAMIIPSSAGSTALQESTGSEVDDAFLVECPVCRTDLRMFGDDDLQAIHVATCLEGHSSSPSFAGGSRHLGIHSEPIFSIGLANFKYTACRKEVRWLARSV
jgi:hypothetical protein